MFRTILFLAALAALAACVLGQAPAQAEASVEIYLAKDDGEGFAGEAATEFAPGDIPIHCIVKLGSPEPATVKMTLVAVKVTGVKAGMQVVSASFTTSDGQNEVYFQGRPHRQWVPGIYRADIMINEEKAGSVEFTVKGNAPAAGASNFVRPRPKQPVRKP